MNEENSKFKHTNHLINETSPYLLQHAHNPVDWYPWGKEALQRAKDENKPILLSIGYSSCHWCHVMAHECFENEEIAAIQNKYFINIKLDREERPDIDNIYMDAVQIMGLRGGWPLNVFITPDQKPFYGGTYFPPEQWTKLLESVADAYENKFDQLGQSAQQFTDNLNQSEAQKYGLLYAEEELTVKDLDTAFNNLASHFDKGWGGFNRAPKFPMPAVWNFMMNYAYFSNNSEAKKHLLFTLDKLGNGGIYDHIGGGFSRYSVDAEWHVPHFEKMLYDNGQLLSLYANAYKWTKKEEYLRTAQGIIDWLKRDMLDKSGGFYSALDADSEGEEGKYYVWSFDEVKQLAGNDFSIIAEYYDISKEGNWEDGKNVLRVVEDEKTLIKELNLSKEDLWSKIKSFNSSALAYRSKRVAPGLDSKMLASWNALTLNGLCDAYMADPSDDTKTLAENCATFIKNELVKDNQVLRLKGQLTKGYLEDYAAVIQAFIKYYETFHAESYLFLADALTQTAVNEFFDEKENLFYYTSDASEPLIVRKKELFDNVIPSSNSIMAINLYRLGILFDNDDYKKKGIQMVLMVNKLVKQEIEYLSNWATASIHVSQPTAEVVLIGKDYIDQAKNFNANYLPNAILMAANSTSTLPLFESKTTVGQSTTFYVCYDKTCKRPTQDVSKAVAEVHQTK
ncbi:MAG: thioredoxin domain-containing protein [Marinoscillum sp.]